MSKSYTTQELMITCLSRQVADHKITATGTLSPIPAAACYLAKLSHAPRAELLIFHAPDWPFESELEELFNITRQGRLDLFFLSGAQIDRTANLNLVAIGDYEKPKVRLPGGAGAAMLYLQAGRSALFLARQNTKSLVEKVDFITAPGGSPGEANGLDRPGGPVGLVTDLAVFDYLPGQGLVPASIHPGTEPGQLQAATGWDLGNLDHLPQTEPPDEDILALIRGPVKEKLKAVYPAFADHLNHD